MPEGHINVVPINIVLSLSGGFTPCRHLMPVIHCTGSSSHTSGSTRIQPRVNRNKKHSRHQASSGPGSTRILLAYTLRTVRRTGIHENPPRVYKYLIVLIWIPVRHALCGSGPRQDPWRVITPLHLMDPGVCLMPGGSPWTPRSGSWALGHLQGENIVV